MGYGSVAVALLTAFLPLLVRAEDQSAPTTAPSAADSRAYDTALIDAARITAREIAQSIQSDQLQIDAIRTRLAGGEADLPRIVADLKRATDKLEARQAAFAPIKARYEQARTRLENEQDKALNQMKQGQEFQLAKAAADEADAERDRAQRLVLARLELSPDYTAADATRVNAEQREDYFQEAGPAFEHERKAFADRAEEAAAKMDAIISAAMDASSHVQEAKRKSTAADAAVRELISQYRKRIASVPAVAAAQADLDAQQGAYDAGLAIVHDGEARVTPIRQAYQRTVEGMAADRAELDELTTDLTDAQTALSRINTKIANASKE